MAPNGYDHIVIGAGSAGCVVAARLSEDPACRVLLLEAGGPNDYKEVRDARKWRLLLDGDLDWRYQSTPQQHCNNRIIACPRGKMLGGCSSHNANIWVHGHRSDFDRWAEQGCAGWDYENVLPVFRRIESWTGTPSDSRGSDGPMHVEPAQDPNPIAQAFIEAGQEIGLPRFDDYNAGQMEGVGLCNLTIKDGQRHNVPAAYLIPAMKRDNLTVLTGAETQRLIVESGKCTAVEYTIDGRLERAMAESEVILCAGAFGSPKILLASGIGPAGELSSLKIPVVLDLPGVGKNLQDHVMLGGLVYEGEGRLPALRNNGVEATVFWKSASQLVGPDIQLALSEFPFATPELANEIPRNCFTIVPCLLRPESRGHVKLKSADPALAPEIELNFLSRASDTKVLKASLELGRDIGGANAFSKMRKREVIPGQLDDAAVLEFIRMSATTYFHPSGTCKMGVDAMSVVDPKLQVYGINSLRIADASIMPDITSGNTNAPTVMIGQRCAEMIKSM